MLIEIDKGLVSGSLALLVMKLLEDGDKYGYEMIEELKRRSDDTFHLKAEPCIRCSTGWRRRIW